MGIGDFFLIVFSFHPLWSGTSELDPKIANNVYYKLYKRRAENAVIDIRKQELTVRLAKLKKEMHEELWEKRAVSRLDAEIFATQYEYEKVELEKTKKRAEEAEAMVDIARTRIKNELDMPVCPGG